MPDTDDIQDLLGDFTQSDEKRLKALRAAAFTKIEELTRGKDMLNAEERAQYDVLDGEVAGYTARIDAGLALRDANRRDADVVGQRVERIGEDGEKDYREAFINYLRDGLLGCSDQERNLLMGKRAMPDGSAPQLRVQNTLTGAAGGFLVPDSFLNRLVEQQKAFGAIEPYVNVITTATGNDISWLTEDDTAQEGELLNEGDQVSNLDIAFGVAVLRAFTYSSKMVLISWQLLQDAVIDIEGLVARVAGRRLARIHTRHFTTGDGINKPRGITVGLSGGKVAASATTWTVDELIDIQHILDPAYRGGTQRWMINDATFKAIRKLADADNNKIWQPSFAAGTPDTILGDPYIVNQAMPLPTTGNVSILYGDFNEGYVVRRVRGATAVRLNEKYADFLQTGYFVYDRMDGRPDNTNAYTYGQQA